MSWVVKKIISVPKSSHCRVEAVFSLVWFVFPQPPTKPSCATGREILCLEYPLVTAQSRVSWEQASKDSGTYAKTVLLSNPILELG